MEDATVHPLHGEGAQEEVHNETSGEVHSSGTPLGGGSVEGDDRHLSAEEQRMVRELTKWRGRFHDVPDEQFGQVIEKLRNRQSIKKIARELVEDGYCAHLNPTTVRVYLTKLRDALGLPGYAEQQEAVHKIAKEDADDEVIEGSPALKRLRWLSRIQQTQVRKALEGSRRIVGLLTCPPPSSPRCF